VSSPDRLNILVVSPQLPYPPSWGFGIRVYHLLRYLSARHRVTLLSYAWGHQGEQVKALRAFCHAVEAVDAPPAFFNARRRAQLGSVMSRAPYSARSIQAGGLQRALDGLLSAESFDLIQVESAPAACLDYHGHPAVVLDEHNVEYELLSRMARTDRSLPRRLFNGLEYLKMRRLEQQAWGSVRACVCTSEADAAIMRRYGARGEVAVVPNGVDLEFFKPGEGSPEPDSLVFTGTFNYRPNVDAATFFVREVLPMIVRARPETVFTIVGASAPAEVIRLSGPHVRVTGWVADVRPYLARAAVVVVPLRMGGGTRLKVLEALAMAKPVVSTTIGSEGLAAIDGEHLLTADRPAAMAEKVVALLEDGSKAFLLGEHGRQLMQRQYGWDAIGESLEGLYRQVLFTARPATRLATPALDRPA
jgi:sugar transferase (PEP-CTERM/EpsH1 system associated)